MDQTTDKEMNFSKRFIPIEREINSIKEKINQKESFLYIIEWHKYTIDELLNSAHHKKIDVISKKIKSDVSYQIKEGKFSYKEQREYNDFCHKTELELINVNQLIEERAPTFWERAFGILQSFVRKISDNLNLDDIILKLPLVRKVKHLIFSKVRLLTSK